MHSFENLWLKQFNTRQAAHFSVKTAQRLTSKASLHRQQAVCKTCGALRVQGDGLFYAGSRLKAYRRVAGQSSLGGADLIPSVVLFFSFFVKIKNRLIKFLMVELP